MQIIKIAKDRAKGFRLTRENFFLLCGFIFAMQVSKLLPPAPIFSQRIGRTNNLQSFENAYFSSVRAYEHAVSEVLRSGQTPLVILGDSTLRGTSASSPNTWDKILEKNLRSLGSNIKVLNLAQNAGDLVGPFLHSHLAQKFPDALFILQQQFSSEVGARHPFHFWLSTELLLLDGKKNAALNVSRAIVPLYIEEREFLFLSSFNILTGYLDLGNWVRFKALGTIDRTSVGRVPIFKPLEAAIDSEPDVMTFSEPSQKTLDQYRYYYSERIKHVQKWMGRSFQERLDYFDSVLPINLRLQTLLLSIDWNPYFMTLDKDLEKTDSLAWRKMRNELVEMKDLNQLTVSHWFGELNQNDYSDLGHINAPGQEKLANFITPKVLEFINKAPLKAQ